MISKTQENYYRALSIIDKTGKSTPFIEYMLEVIDNSLKELLLLITSNETPVELNRDYGAIEL